MITAKEAYEQSLFHALRIKQEKKEKAKEKLKELWPIFTEEIRAKIMRGDFEHFLIYKCQEYYLEFYELAKSEFKKLGYVVGELDSNRMDLLGGVEKYRFGVSWGSK